MLKAYRRIYFTMPFHDFSMRARHASRARGARCKAASGGDGMTTRRRPPADDAPIYSRRRRFRPIWPPPCFEGELRRQPMVAPAAPPRRHGAAAAFGELHANARAAADIRATRPPAQLVSSSSRRKATPPYTKAAGQAQSRLRGNASESA